jgi:hypothetical protein
MGTKAITPQEIMDNLPNIIPSTIIEAVNKLLSNKFRGREVYIKQDEIIDEVRKLSNITREEIFENKWLDFETIYQDSGWEVTYDKPGIGETYQAYFKFKPLIDTMLKK